MSRLAQPPKVPRTAIDAWRRDILISQKRTDASTLETFERELRAIARIASRKYGTPNLGNFRDPTDEFVYIVLSRKTVERAYIKAFYALKASGSWAKVMEQGQSKVARIITGCGLEKKKARAIVEGLALIKTQLGSSSLSAADLLPDDELFRFLCSLPEFGPKSAYCVMLYSFSRPVFPVDAHVGRVFARLGIARLLGISIENANHKERQALLRDVVPPDLRFGLHVNFIMHGRRICKAMSPLCASCSLTRHCTSSAGRARSQR